MEEASGVFGNKVIIFELKPGRIQLVVKNPTKYNLVIFSCVTDGAKE
jgi:hypothetical protein